MGSSDLREEPRAPQAGDGGVACPSAGPIRSPAEPRQLERRILLLLPFGPDGELARNELELAGLEPEVCSDVKELVRKVGEGAGVAVLGEEVLARGGTAELFQVFDAQQTWSDLPVIVLIRHDGPLPDSLVPLRAFERHAKIKTTFLQRPVPALSLVSSIRAGLKSRLRQYQVRDLLAQLNEDVRQRDEFLAMLGHELRNPVSSIGYVAELFEMAGVELTPERVAWGARVIGRQVRHLSRLLDQLLDVARVQSGKIQLEKEPVDLRSIVEQCVEASDMSRCRREVTLRLAERPATVLGDRVRLSQIVNNLLENAVKYTADGGRVEVEVGCDGGDATLSVSDDGRGMSPETLRQVFKPFFQEARTRTGRSAGLGLGLAMVDNLVRLHGGTITAHSAGEGCGSRFEMRLPRLGRDAVGEPTPSLGGGSLRLLIVEDNAEVAQLFSILLDTLGHKTKVVHSGLAGVEAAIESRPDLAFVDIGLPDMDGAEVARRIRAEFPEGGPRLVALTGFPERPEDGGVFDDYLLKPVSRQRVEELLRAL